ncbi:MAG: hypothetical protein MMC23_005710 [Stictis urceolatum]|nr:hypothetical protein [Stictis urceolata]
MDRAAIADQRVARLDRGQPNRGRAQIIGPPQQRTRRTMTNAELQDLTQRMVREALQSPVHIEETPRTAREPDAVEMERGPPLPDNNAEPRQQFSTIRTMQSSLQVATNLVTLIYTPINAVMQTMQLKSTNQSNTQAAETEDRKTACEEKVRHGS